MGNYNIANHDCRQAADLGCDFELALVHQRANMFQLEPRHCNELGKQKRKAANELRDAGRSTNVRKANQLLPRATTARSLNDLTRDFGMSCP
jgi:hypothetical protein